MITPTGLQRLMESIEKDAISITEAYIRAASIKNSSGWAGENRRCAMAAFLGQLQATLRTARIFETAVQQNEYSKWLRQLEKKCEL